MFACSPRQATQLKVKHDIERSDVIFFAVVVGFVQAQCSPVRWMLHAGAMRLSGDSGGRWSPSMSV